MEVSCAAHETSTLYPRNLNYKQKIQSLREISSLQRFMYFTFLWHQNLLPQSKKKLKSNVKQLWTQCIPSWR